MPFAPEAAIGLLGRATGINMQTVQANTIFTVPNGKVCRIYAVLIKNYTGSLAGAGATSYSVTNWRTGIDLSGITTLSNTGYFWIPSIAITAYTEIAAATAVQFTVVTGSTASVTATIEIYGTLDSV